MARCVLFLLSKRGYDYGEYGEYGGDSEYGCGGCGSCANCTGKTVQSPGEPPWSRNSGLFNSCAFVVDMLNASGMPARLIQVGNEQAIRKAITSVEPSDVIFEAFFVIPALVNALSAENPCIRFFVRNHSELAFLAYDSNALGWMADYLRNPHMHISSNSARSTLDLRHVAKSYQPHWDDETIAQRVRLLPNYHPTQAPLPRVPSPFGTLNVGCFGAFRPLKNQLLQAICAIEVARRMGRRLRFHINGSRVEHRSSGVLKNIRALFANSSNSELVEHEWLPRSQFLDLARRMDIGMQVSISETFNIITADFVQNDIPVLGSHEIPWLDRRVQADPASGRDIIHKMMIALRADSITCRNREGLLRYNANSREAWLSVFGGPVPECWSDEMPFPARPAITAMTTHL
jgi:hypothetical protein